MSNPAVIVLDKVNSIKKIERFVIEDNIGESIHIHFDNIRIDFTVKEYLDFSNTVRESILEMDLLSGYDLSNFDESFLKNCSSFLPKLEKISKEKIKLKELICIKHMSVLGEIIDIKCGLKRTKGFEYLEGDSQDFLRYPQENYYGMDNESRLNSLKQSIKENGYPFDENYIVLFNGEDIIRDGQHRAIVLAHLYGLDYEIDILRFHFEGSKHRINIFIPNVKKLIKSFILKCYKILRKFLRK